MNESYFTYLLDEISLFSEKENIKLLKRQFTGFPFDEKSKEIISKVTKKKQLTEENKLKLQEVIETEKKLSMGTEFKTGPLSQEIYDRTGTIQFIAFAIFFFFLILYSINILSKIETTGAVRYIFFFISILAGSITVNSIKILLNKKARAKHRLHSLMLLISGAFFLAILIISFLINPGESYWRYSPFMFFAILPFIIYPVTLILSIIIILFIKIIMKFGNRMEVKWIRNKKMSDLKNIKEKREEVERKIDAINKEIEKTQGKLSDEKISLIKDLSQKYKHIFFPFNLMEENRKEDIIQANQAIAIGDYMTGLTIVEKTLGKKIEDYSSYHFWQGINKTEKNQCQEGEEYLNNLIKTGEPSTDVYLALSFLYLKSNKGKAVEQLMKKEPLLSYNRWEKHFLKGLALFLEEKYDLSELDLQKALSLNPDNETIMVFLFLVILKLKNYTKLSNLLKNFNGSSDIKDMFLGVSEYRQKNYKKSIQYFNKILKNDINHLEAISFRELSNAQIKVHPIFRKKNLAQRLISRLPENMDRTAIACYTVAKLYQLEGLNKKALNYLEKAYENDPEHPEITVDLAKYYFKNPCDNVFEMEIMLKAIPILGGKKRFFRNLLSHLLKQKEVDKKILNLLEKQYFKNINYDPLMVKVLAKNYLYNNKMDERSTEIYLKAIEIKCLDEEESLKAEKLITWYDAEKGRLEAGRDNLYKKLLEKYPDDERLIFLNTALLNKEQSEIEENPELFKNILEDTCINSRFWNIFNLKRKNILKKIVCYYKDKKIYNEGNKKLIEEAYDTFTEDREILLAFGEHGVKTERYDRKSLEIYKKIYKENPENGDNLVALGKSYIKCDEINFESINVLEEIFTKELVWDEAIKILTKHYIKKRKDGNLKKEFIVLFVWGKYTELEPTDYQVRFYIAEELFARKDYLQASEKYEEVIALSPTHRDASYRLGECYLQMGKNEEATETFKKILSQRNDIETINMLGKIYLEIYKDEKEAANYYEKASKIDTNNVENLKILLEIYKKDRDTSNMIKVQEKLASIEPTGENLATLGHFYLKTNRLEKGIEKLEKARKKGFYAGGKVNFMIGEAKYYLLEKGASLTEWEELINILSEAIKLGCRDKKLYEMRYQAYLKTGDKKKAAEDRKIFDPDDLDNLYQLVIENQERGDKNVVKENLMQIYRKNSAFLDVSLRLAKIYSEEKSFDKKHIDIILQAFSSSRNLFLRNDKDCQMISHLHNYYKSKDLFSEEIEFLKKVLKNENPYNEGKLNSWIALALLELGEMDKACELLMDIDMNLAREDLLDAHMRLAEELLYRENFKKAEEILEKIYLIDPTYKNVGNLLENFRKKRTGRFALLEAVGSGSNAMVYKAFDLVTRNHVAVKILHPDLERDREAVNNFKKEYEILEECIHPGIAKVIPGSFNKNYFALELLDKSLANVMEVNENGLGINEFFSISTQIVEALHYMHSKNIIYHDLAPDNVMFAGDIIKFCDLGGAKKFDLKTRETIIGSTEKHYLYASPEQCKHEFDTSIKVDHRSDIYSFGALMYQMLTGKPPFIGPDQALISAHQHSKPSPIISQKENIPRQLTSIILKALEKNPEDRQQSMEEILQELMQTPRG